MVADVKSQEAALGILGDFVTYERNGKSIGTAAAKARLVSAEAAIR